MDFFDQTLISRRIVLRVLLSLFVTLYLSSCIGLRNNYLGKGSRQRIPFKVDVLQMTRLDSVRKHMDIHLDSLVSSLAAKGHTRHLKANEINELFSGFGTDLDYDRIFNSMLQNGSLNAKHLSC
jgi:hypothetical protein